MGPATACCHWLCGAPEAGGFDVALSNPHQRAASGKIKNRKMEVHMPAQLFNNLFYKPFSLSG
jgi:hypothetical protein